MYTFDFLNIVAGFGVGLSINVVPRMVFFGRDTLGNHRRRRIVHKLLPLGKRCVRHCIEIRGEFDCAIEFRFVSKIVLR